VAPIYAVFAAVLALGAGGPLLAVPVFLVVLVLAALVVEPSTTWTGMAPTHFDGRRLHGKTVLGKPASVDLDEVRQAAYVRVGGRYARLVGCQLLLANPGGRRMSRARLRRILRPRDEADHLDDGALVTFVLLDPWWEHEVLRPVGNRLISDPVALSPRLRRRLQEARDEDPTEPVGRPGRRRKQDQP
jgi:hypothetical protein